MVHPWAQRGTRRCDLIEARVGNGPEARRALELDAGPRGQRGKMLVQAIRGILGCVGLGAAGVAPWAPTLDPKDKGARGGPWGTRAQGQSSPNLIQFNDEIN